MTFQTLALCFPIVLALHNADEYRHNPSFLQIHAPWLPARWIGPRNVRAAMVLLTLTAVALAVWNFIARTLALQMATEIAIAALALNAIGHCALSLLRKSLLPGTLSALLLVLPYSIAVGYILRSRGESKQHLAEALLLGAIGLPLVTVLFLWLGHVTSPKQSTG